jgi:hypothetical protein
MLVAAYVHGAHADQLSTRVAVDAEQGKVRSCRDGMALPEMLGEAQGLPGAV